jgi:hypothetical protein
MIKGKENLMIRNKNKNKSRRCYLNNSINSNQKRIKMINFDFKLFKMKKKNINLLN